MKKEALIHLAKSVNAITNIPAHIHDETNDKILAAFHTVGEFSNDEEINEHLRSKYQNIVTLADGQNIGYYISDDLIAIGKVRDKSTKLCLIIGGCKLADINKTTADNMLINAKNAMEVIEAPSTEKFMTYMRRFPRMTPLYFMWLLSLINTAINQSVEDLSSFVSQDPLFNNPDKQADGIFIKTREFTGDEESGKDKVNVEKILISYVIKGDIKGVNKYWREIASDYKSYSSIFLRDSLRQAKNSFISLVTLISRAVIEEGVAENLSCMLADSYMVRAEGSLSVEEFDNLIPSMLKDFTMKVKDLQESTTDDNYIVKRAISYIKDHVAEKIVITDISSSLRISNGYLSSLFKKSTGMYITDFINKQKILESARLLDNTDKTLSEITNHFSFSSQSYYQNIFKKFMGMTPTEYRKKNKHKK